MTNRLYDKGREAFLTGQINWLTDDIRALLIDTNDYPANTATDQFLSDIPPAAIVATSGSLGTRDATAGVADAADVTWPTVTGDQSEAVVLYKHTGVSGTARLIAYIDVATGLPVTPNGGDIVVQWDNGANKIFKL